jgi:hypothetical protein
VDTSFRVCSQTPAACVRLPFARGRHAMSERIDAFLAGLVLAGVILTLSI